uniref:hypothetical protein n=1 Tax=Enterocloster clostridioformis TaxID=1531 RepID=UPI0026EA409E|nr:hypothetical protein [Enterocloster clostridioformis]
MPTKKPRIQALLEESDYKKFQSLCKTKDRTESKLAGIIIKEFLDKYEAEHGKIKVDEQTGKKSSKTVNIGRDNIGTINM